MDVSTILKRIIGRYSNNVGKLNTTSIGNNYEQYKSLVRRRTNCINELDYYKKRSNSYKECPEVRIKLPNLERYSTFKSKPSEKNSRNADISNTTKLIKNILFKNENIHDNPITIKKFSFATRAGQSFGGISKINQDCIIIEDKLGKNNAHLFAIADGHGEFGATISQFIKSKFPSIFL